MVILDTNVISALMRPRENPEVRAWLDTVPRTLVWTTAISVLEIRFGLLIMADGRRRSDLTVQFDGLLQRQLRAKMAPFDRSAAEHAAKVSASKRLAGRRMETADAQIAGIALSLGAAVATRNAKDFSDLGLELIDPWTAPSYGRNAPP
jgi:toxin FitB